MRALLYKLKVSNGWLEASHGFTTTIQEIHIPVMNISVNVAEDDLHIFTTHENRYDKALEEAREIDIPSNIVQAIEDYLEKKDLVERSVKSWWNSHISGS
jgi:sporulation protein YlmC with PRC-barrel domain